jgi:hypothetical protein
VRRDNLTPAAYARARGLARSTISRQIRDGKISLTAAGLIDPKAADRARNRNLEPARRARAEQRKLQKLPGPQDPDSGALPEPPAGPSDDFEAPPSGSLAAAQLVFADAKARRATLELAVLEGKLIDADAVRTAQFERATAEREALLNWPSRIAAGMAAKLDVAERDVFLALTAEVRLFLMERSHVPVDGPNGPQSPDDSLLADGLLAGGQMADEEKEKADVPIQS